MAQIDSKRPSITLYVEPSSPLTHWLCFVLAEKSIEPNIIFVDPKKPPQDLLRISPHQILPTLLDREGLLLYRPSIIAEYLEERFPHPPLLPVYPIQRARCRQMIYQIEQDWYVLLQRMKLGQQVDQSQTRLQKNVLNLVPLLSKKPYYLLSEELTLADCCLAPILWRLHEINSDLFEEAPLLLDYQNRLFERSTFKASLYPTHRQNEFDDLC